MSLTPALDCDISSEHTRRCLCSPECPCRSEMCLPSIDHIMVMVDAYAVASGEAAIADCELGPEAYTRRDDEETAARQAVVDAIDALRESGRAVASLLPSYGEILAASRAAIVGAVLQPSEDRTHEARQLTGQLRRVATQLGCGPSDGEPWPDDMALANAMEGAVSSYSESAEIVVNRVAELESALAAMVARVRGTGGYSTPEEQDVLWRAEQVLARHVAAPDKAWDAAIQATLGGPRCFACNRFRLTSDGTNYDKVRSCGAVNPTDPHWAGDRSSK